MFESVGRHGVRPPLSVSAALPPPMVRLLQYCWSAHPIQRPSARWVHREVERMLEEEEEEQKKKQLICVSACLLPFFLSFLHVNQNVVLPVALTVLEPRTSAGTTQHRPGLSRWCRG
jgi:hypothetical protein